jgi:hypothetical protein
MQVKAEFHCDGCHHSGIMPIENWKINRIYRFLIIRRKPQYPEKTISLSQVIDNFYRDDPMITTMKAPSRIEKTNSSIKLLFIFCCD